MTEKKKINSYVINTIIGLGIMTIFWIIPPIDPITPIGMRCVGIFLGMVYLWSTVDALWPSIVGICIFGISGYGGGFGNVWLNAIGNNTVLISMFSMILFGALHEAGVTRYIAKWFLTKKVFKGRPYVFLIIWFMCCGAMAALISPVVTLIILWPVSLSLMATLKIERNDQLWPYFFCGMFLTATLMQPFFPFKGAQLIPISAFENMTASMGTAYKVPYLGYMFTDLVMTVLIMTIYLLAMKFVLRVDTNKLKAVDPAMLEEQMQLPPMNFQQKAYLYMMALYLVMLLVPGFVKGNPICDFLNSISTLGCTLFWIALFMIIHWEGKPILNFKEVVYKQLNWGVVFMVAAAIYGANSLSNASTGVSDFLVKILNPILGGQSELAFIAILFTFALILTNFANNAAMAVVLMPVAITFSEQLGIHPMPVAMGITLMVFVAMLTPAASPHAGLMHGRRDIYTTLEIMKIGFPMCVVCLLLYIFVGYPLMKILLL